MIVLVVDGLDDVGQLHRPIGFRRRAAINLVGVEGIEYSGERAEERNDVEEEAEGDGAIGIDAQVSGADHESHLSRTDASDGDRHCRGNAAEQEEEEIVGMRAFGIETEEDCPRRAHLQTLDDERYAHGLERGCGEIALEETEEKPIGPYTDGDESEEP